MKVQRRRHHPARHIWRLAVWQLLNGLGLLVVLGVVVGLALAGGPAALGITSRAQTLTWSGICTLLTLVGAILLGRAILYALDAKKYDDRMLHGRS